MERCGFPIIGPDIRFHGHCVLPSLDGATVPITILHVFTSGFLTLKFLAFLRGFAETGWLITVLVQNVKDIGRFLVILSVILLGFTGMFRSLLQTVEGDCELYLESTADDAEQLREECDDAPFASFLMVAFGVFNMGIMRLRHEPLR